MFHSVRMLAAGCVMMAAASSAFAQGVQTNEKAIPNQYIVVLDDEEVAAARVGVGAMAAEIARVKGARVIHVYEHALRGFAAQMSAASASDLARDPRVRLVEQDSVMSIVATQTNATWGLDRIDQRNLPLNTTYVYNTTASGVHAYIIDTGIRATHAQFTGRIGNGFTAVSDGNGTNDCNGHGTHVAGTVGGTTYGVAKGVTLHAVRVLGCNGSGTTSGVIAGVDWVTSNHASPAVANMSLGGGASAALDTAVTNSINSGVVYAIAAGNSNANACNSSPARVGAALTVGATTNTDARSSFSNFGTCLDLFAPGSSITSAWSTSDSATNTISGTSMAAPHVAGVAALYRAANPSVSPSAVVTAVVTTATPNVVGSPGTGSPNRLVYSIFGAPPADAPPTASFVYSCSLLTCTFNGSGSSDDNGITAYSWAFGDGGTGSGVSVGHAYAAAGTYQVTLTVTDTAGQTGSQTQSVSVSGGGGTTCTSGQTYTGSLSGTGASQYQPNGTYYYSAVAGVHRGCLEGPAGTDFDLFLQRWNGFWWSTVARSESADSIEEINYNGSVGYYRWRIYSYSGSGPYTFRLLRP